MQVNIFFVLYVYFMLVIALLFFLNRLIPYLRSMAKPKITVKYHRADGGTEILKKSFNGNIITLKAGSKGRGLAPITAKFTRTCINEEPYFFGLLKRKYVDLVEGATRCVDYAIDSEKAPNITQEGVKEYSQLSAIYRAGTVHQKQDYNIISLITLFLVGLLFLHSMGFI